MSEEAGSPQEAERARGSVEIVELSPAQQSFARRVAESKATAPHVYFEHPVNAPHELASLIAGSARTLRRLPLLNGAYRDGRFERYSRVNVAFGVEVLETLVLPVVHDADRKDRDAIAAEIEELDERARAGTLAAPAMAGGTFTVLDMSAGGAATFTPVITRGQAATLGAGTASLTLACDNRIVQGSEGARFLGSLLEELAAARRPPS